jgi:alkylation response protein AidB-like acyl-CoA dehydrogenase
MEELLSANLLNLRATAEAVTRDHIAPHGAQVDADCAWPGHSLRALADAGLLGLQVPRRLGGHGEGLLALAVITETIARACASSAMCYAMHCVGTAVIAAKATPYHEERYLRAIAAGRHITTLALSEAGTGAHFYLPQTELERDGRQFVVRGSKHFVTNGGQADSYVLSTRASSPDAAAGEFSCLVVDGDAPGMTWLDPWRGLGMRGNASRGLRLDGVRMPEENLLGAEGDQIWYVFEVVAPYFLIAMAATYLGIAQAALDVTLPHLTTRHHEHTAGSLAEVPVLQHKVAEMWMAVEKLRGLTYHAAKLGDLGHPGATAAIMAAKADAGDTSVWVTNEAMTCCGGIAYRENGVLGRLLRDARASHVMSPTTHLLKTWIGRAVLGQPLL